MVKGRGKTARVAAASVPRVARGAHASGDPASGDPASGGFVTGGSSAPYDPSADPFWQQGAYFEFYARVLRETHFRTRAEYEERKAQRPNAVEIVGKLMAFAEAEGLPIPGTAWAVQFRFGDAYAEWLGGEKDPRFATRLAPHEVRQAEDRLTAAMEKYDKSMDVTALSMSVKESSRKFDPEVGVEEVKRRYESSRNNQFRSRQKDAVGAALLVVGWYGRPTTIERAAEHYQTTPSSLKKSLKYAEREYGFAIEELAHLAAHKHGRRYLWPDERAGLHGQRVKGKKKAKGVAG